MAIPTATQDQRHDGSGRHRAVMKQLHVARARRTLGRVTTMIREAVPADVPEILRLVQALADYERESDAVEATADDFARALFPETGPPTTHALIAEHDGAVVGMAVWFVTFSTWTGRNGIWLEDLFVDPAHRGVGAGKALLTRLAQICVERSWTRLEWVVLNWNEPAVAFYESLGSVPMNEWQTRRLQGEALRSLGTP